MTQKALLQSAGDGTAVPSGYVGEYKESTSFVIPATGARGDLTTLTLSAGIWDVYGCVLQVRNSATYSPQLFILSVITASGNVSTGEVDGVNKLYHQNSFATSPDAFNISTPMVRVISDGTNMTIAGLQTSGQVIRLKYYPGGYSGATPTVTGIFRAIRIA